MDFSNEMLLVESKTARDQGLSKLKNQHSEEKILNKVKNLFFAVWRGVGRITRQQLADFYEVPRATIDSNYQDHQDEFQSDGAGIFEKSDLKELKGVLPLSQSSPKETVYTPAAALRMGFILRDSEVAKIVRTTAIRFIQGVGLDVNNQTVLRSLTASNKILSPLIEGGNLTISSPYLNCWEAMKSTLSKKYPNGGVEGFSDVDDIRKEIQFLSGYTDNFKLQGVKELRYELASKVRGKYPDLISEVFTFDIDGEAGSAVFMFEFHNLIIDAPVVESCVGRNYIRVAKEFLQVDRAYLIFVSPFGATSYAHDYIKKHLVSEYQDCVGVLTLQQLAQFLYNQAVSSRQLGTIKGEITTEFGKFLNYKFPEPPPLYEQLTLNL